MTQAASLPAATKDAGLDAEIVIEDDRWRLHEGIEATVEAAVRAVGNAVPRVFNGDCGATIQLDNDANIAKLNARFRNKQAATNVLSFPSGPTATEPGAPRYLGDVIIARETVEREASELGISVCHHVQHLVIHGLLHLAGHDHITEADAGLMEALETRLLAGLGAADPYAPLDRGLAQQASP